MRKIVVMSSPYYNELDNTENGGVMWCNAVVCDRCSFRFHCFSTEEKDAILIERPLLEDIPIFFRPENKHKILVRMNICNYAEFRMTGDTEIRDKYNTNSSGYVLNARGKCNQSGSARRVLLASNCQCKQLCSHEQMLYCQGKISIEQYQKITKTINKKWR